MVCPNFVICLDFATLRMLFFLQLWIMNGLHFFYLTSQQIKNKTCKNKTKNPPKTKQTNPPNPNKQTKNQTRNKGKKKPKNHPQKRQHNKDVSIVFVKLFLTRPTTGSVSKYRLEGCRRDKFIACLCAANCPMLTHAGARKSPLKNWLLCCSVESCTGEDSLQKSQCKLLILNKGILPDSNEITVSLLSFFLKLSCLLLNTFRIKDVVKKKRRAAVHKSIKTCSHKAQQGTWHLISHSVCFTKWKMWQTSGSFQHCR